jgi:SAM-dependent methyltransferase
VLARLLDLLVCPQCQGRLVLAEEVREGRDEVESGRLRCPDGHAYPVVGGIPRLLPSGSDSSVDRVRESFSREWTNHKLGMRTWYLDLDTRVRGTFVEALEIPAEELATKRVLDAGCGNGSQSVAFTEFAAEVVALDLSTGLALGHAFRDRWSRGRREAVHFVQGDVARPPLPPGSVDVVYSFGVLHHTPDTRTSFQALVPLLRPGGTFYVWVYRYEPFWTPLIRLLRAVTTRVPVALFDRLTRVLAWPFIAFTMAATATGIRTYPRIDRREATLALMDIFAAPYAHHHSPAEVRAWFAEAGFSDVRECNHARRGFAVVGRLASRD